MRAVVDVSCRHQFTLLSPCVLPMALSPRCCSSAAPPVLLELGGKSPVIVDSEVDVAVAAR